MSNRIRWLGAVVDPEILGNQVSAARSIEVVDKPSAEMCLQCRGTRLLCGKPRCPILAQAESMVKHERAFASALVEGSSPGGVFVGRFGYPKVYVGPMVPPYHGNTEILDTPEHWLGRSVDEIVGYRFALVRGNMRANIFDVQTGGRLIERIQELSMVDRPVDAELRLTKRPRKVLVLSEDSQPLGPSAPLNSFNLTNVAVDRRLEAVHYDRHLKAAGAVVELYQKGVLVSRIQRAFSVGAFGIERARKLVPTRWSITAVDSLLSQALIDKIKRFETIDEYRVHADTYFDNRYVALLMPEPWKFEWIEAWFPQTHWNAYGASPALMGDYEEYWGRTTYASVGGCYYSTRLAAAERLKADRRQAGSILLREIHPGYLLPLGVWNVRESIRSLLAKPPAKFDTLHAALTHAVSYLRIPLPRWIAASTLLRRALSQGKITDFV